LKQEQLAQLPRASQPLALRQSDALQDELPSRQQVRQDVQHPELCRGRQLRERATQHRALQQLSPEQPAPHRQQRASRPQLQAQREPPRQASPLASSRPSLSQLFPPPQLLQQPPDRGNACAPVLRASGQSSSSASFFR